MLGIDLQAPPDQVHRAYRKAVKRWHPDQFAQAPLQRSAAESQLKTINLAYAQIKAYLKDHYQSAALTGSPASQHAPSGASAFARRAAMAYQSQAALQRFKPAVRPCTARGPRRTQNFQQALRAASAQGRTSNRQGIDSPTAIRSSQQYVSRRRRSSGSTISPIEPISKARPVPPVGAIGEWD